MSDIVIGMKNAVEGREVNVSLNLVGGCQLFNAAMLDTHLSTRKLSNEVSRALCSLALQVGPQVLCRLPVVVFSASSHISNIIQLILSNFLGAICTHIIISL